MLYCIGTWIYSVFYLLTHKYDIKKKKSNGARKATNKSIQYIVCRNKNEYKQQLVERFEYAYVISK